MEAGAPLLWSNLREQHLRGEGWVLEDRTLLFAGGREFRLEARHDQLVLAATLGVIDDTDHIATTLEIVENRVTAFRRWWAPLARASHSLARVGHAAAVDRVTFLLLTVHRSRMRTACETRDLRAELRSVPHRWTRECLLLADLSERYMAEFERRNMILADLEQQEDEEAQMLLTVVYRDISP